MLNSIAFVVPVFLLFILIEWYLTIRAGKKFFSESNTAINLAIGAIDQIFSLIIFLAFYTILYYVYNNYRIITLDTNWLQWVLAYFAVDFISYWYHRFSHRVNILWAGHITHHSSSHYNFTNGFRTSPFQSINRIPFWMLLAWVGFNPFVLLFTFKISGIFDFFQHTQSVKKLGWIEKFMITPSTHRVHHGKNDIYIDKNYGSNFVIWDKLFGTFEPETETVVYGVKDDSYIDNNPWKAIFSHYSYLWNSMKLIPNWSDKIKLLFMPPDWQPSNIKSKTNFPKKELVEIVPQYKFYGYLQLILCAVSVDIVLLFKNILPVHELVIFSISSVLGIINGALILNTNIGKNFRTLEITRLLITSFILLFCYLAYKNYYLLFTFGYFLISLYFAFKLPKPNIFFMDDGKDLGLKN